MNATRKNTLDTPVLAHRIRRHAVNMTSTGKSSHVGSVLSIADILAVLYGTVLNVDSEQPRMENRDRFILSKGHAGAGVYAALAETGFFDPELLKQHYQNGSIFSGHVSHKGVPGVEISTGSLGHGLGVGTGMALAAARGEEPWRTFVLMSDGECDEGSNWEAAQFAGHHKLSNLTAIIDYNKIQSLASVADTLALEPFADKWQAFNWDVVEADGHDHDALKSALTTNDTSMPRVVIAHTTKGKGIPMMENQVLWHYRNAQGAEYEEAIAALDAIDPEKRDA